ncbi:hypothetical protein AB6A40_009086 [Gnathostoma spinigerum]|uniref:Secreted protein n=1 Tax=Gnathostoma spinigerum TaxID=75299 RepID=A0ABD6ETB9_9BILA
MLLHRSLPTFLIGIHIRASCWSTQEIHSLSQLVVTAAATSDLHCQYNVEMCIFVFKKITMSLLMRMALCTYILIKQ